MRSIRVYLATLAAVVAGFALIGGLVSTSASADQYSKLRQQRAKQIKQCNKAVAKAKKTGNKQKIRKAKTDADGLPSDPEGLKGRPEAENLVGIYAALAGKGVPEVLAEFGGGQFSAFKNALAELAVLKLAPIAGEMNRLLADPGYVEAVLKDGSERARAIAQPVMRDVRRIMGFVVS